MRNTAYYSSMSSSQLDPADLYDLSPDAAAEFELLEVASGRPPAAHEPDKARLSDLGIVVRVVIGAFLLSLLVSAGAAFILLRPSAKVTGVPSGVPRAPGVLTGHLAWRTIATAGSPSDTGQPLPQNFGTVLAGDLDGDGKDELVFDSQNGSIDMLRLDGTPLGSFPSGPMPLECLWDSNGDSKLELIRTNFATGTEAVDAHGTVLQTLPYPMLDNCFAGGVLNYPLGDADGDGKPELWVRPGLRAGRGVAALNSQGRLLLLDPKAGTTEEALICDYDGNGKCVRLTTDQQGELTATGIGGTRRLGHVWRLTSLGCCLDINGDGQRDVLCAPNSYFDHATGMIVQSPPDSDFALTETYRLHYTLFDLDGDAKPEAVYAGLDDTWNSQGSALGSRLRIFQPGAQSALYDEALDERHFPHVTVAHDAGKRFLVVAENDKVLIYP